MSITSATGTKTFTGAVTINAGGQLTESAAAALVFGSDVTINGTLTESGAATVGVAGSLANNGTYSASTGVHTFSGTTKTFSGTISIPSVSISGSYQNNGALTVSTALAGEGSLTQGPSDTLNIGGTSTITTLTATASGNTVNYNGTTQTVHVNDYQNLTLSTSGVKTMTGVTTIGGDLTISGTATMTGNIGFTVTGALNYQSTSGTTTLTATTPISVGKFNQSGTGGVFADNGNTITVTGTGAGTWVKSAGTFTATGTVEFTGAAPQIGASNFKHLTINVGNGNTATLAGAITVTGTLTINSGTTLDTSAANSYGVALDGDFVKNGTFTANGSTITIEGTAATQAIDGFTTMGLVLMTKTAGTATFNGDVNGNGLTINGSGGTLNLGAARTHTFTGAWTRTVGTLDGGSSTLKIGGSVSGTGDTFTANTGTVEWDASGAQTIAAVTYHNLIFSGSGAKSLTSGTSAGGNLSIASGASASVGSGLNLAVNSLTLGGSAKGAGTWGGTGSGASYINTTYFAATTGILTVTTGGSTTSVTLWPTASPITYGQTLASSTLSGGSATPAGTFVWTTPTTMPGAGTASYSVTYVPSDDTYNTVSSTVSLLVNKKALSVTAPSIASKVYNATATAGAVTVGTLSGFVGSETVTATATAADYSSANANSYPGVVVTYVLANGTFGGLAANYSLANGTATGEITAKSLSITAPTIAAKLYDTTATAGAVTVGTLSGFVSPETVTATATAADYSSSAAGSYAGTVVTYTLHNGTLGGLAGNYSLANGSATGQINALPVTLSGTRVYDGTWEATAGSSALVVANNLDEGNLTLSGSVALAGKDVGSRDISQPAIARVGSAATGSTGGSAANSFAVTVTAPTDGNTLVAVISTRGTASGQVTGISQTGAAWLKAVESVNASGETTEIWYAPGVYGAGTAVTINLAASLFASAVIAEYDGVLSVNPVDETASSTGNSTAAATGTTATTSQADELWVGGVGLPGTTPSLGTPDNGFTLLGQGYSTGSAVNNASVYALERIANSAGAASSGGTISGGSAGIALRGVSSAPGTTTSTSLTVNKPAGVVAGDVMIVNIAQNGNNTTAPNLTGWTLISGASLAGSTARYGAVLYRVADGTEGTTFTFALGTGVTSAVGDIAAFSGVDTSGANPFDVAPVAIAVSAASQTGVAATTLTTASANAAVIMFGMAAASARTWSGWTTTSPGALVELYDGQSTTASVGAAWATKATAGATGAGAATLSTAERNGGILIALKPATGVQWAGAIATFKRASTLTLGGPAQGNYTLSVASGSVAITAKSLSVSGLTAGSKTYDGNPTATLGGTASLLTAEAPGTGSTGDGTPYTGDAVTLGGAAAGTFANKNIGTGKAVTVTGNSISGAQSGNYSLVQQTGLSANITTLAITVTAGSASKPADGNTSSAGVPTIVPALVGGDTSGFIQTYDTAAAGTGKTLTPSGSANDNNSGNNYSVTFQAVSTGTITPAALDHFDISAISSPQVARTAVTGITLTAQDAYNNTVTSFASPVAYSGTAGITGTSAALADGVLTGVSVTPTVTGVGMTFIVTGSGKTGTATFDVNPAEGDYRSLATGNWNVVGTWERWNGSSWTVTPPDHSPTFADEVITVLSGHTVTVTANVAVDQVVVELGATLAVANEVAVTLNDGAGVDLDVFGTLKLTGNGSVGGAGHFTMETDSTLDTSAAGTLTVETTGTSTNIVEGVIANGDAPLALVKSGSAGSTLTLSGVNTYSGDTTISAGTLALSGSGSIVNSPNIILVSGATFDVSGLSAALVLGSGQTLKGNGTVVGELTVGSGATISPGLSIGSLTFLADTTLEGTANMEINKTGVALTSDKIQVLSPGVTLTYGGTLAVTLFSGSDALSGGEVFDLFDATTFSGSFGTKTLPTLPVATPALNWYTAGLAVDGTIAVNRAPVGGSHAVTTRISQALAINTTKLKAKDSDADSDSLSITAVSSPLPSGALVSLSGTTITYTPLGTAGSGSFQYTLDDNHGGTSLVTVDVTITAGSAGGVSPNVVYGPVVDTAANPDQFVVRFAGVPGSSYTIERSVDGSPPWTKVVNLTAPTLNTAGFGVGVFEFRENIDVAGSGFFRTVFPSY